ncbi:MAG: 5-oxoprolinase subunit PxpB [Xanthomonadaceae bacterium]|nr:5-oxoprolinase subunit PxpB [Xanthomonadaceae bacterium]
MDGADCVFEALGESALLLRFGNAIDRALNDRVHAAAVALRAAALPGVEDIAPAYASLLLRFDPRSWTDIEAFARAVRAALARPRAVRSDEQPVGTAVAELPVCYGGEHGPDLAEVAALTRLTQDQVIARHVAGDYRVAMLGFAPGFAYLLGLDAALAVPRLTSPRLRVPAGSVAIGGAQTGVYPSVLPGGWRLIGRTPLRLFDAARPAPARLTPGLRVRFRAIDTATFTALSEHDA